jgi:hypothetical protein
VSPGQKNCVDVSARKAGLQWVFVVPLKKMPWVEFRLKYDSYHQTNRERFEKLYRQKDNIENDFGEALNWDFKECRNQQYIKSHCRLGNLDDTEKWSDIQKDMVDRLVRLEKAIGPYMDSL